MAQAVFGIADTLARAEAIVTELRDAGFPSASISMLSPSVHTESVVQQAHARDILTRNGATDVAQAEEARV